MPLTGFGSTLGSVASGGDSAEIWHAWVGESSAALAGLTANVLSASERDRLSRYRNDVAASRYVVTRALVRSVLARHLSVPASEIPISQTDYGKPVVAGAVHFNVSHSGDLVLMAVSTQRPVGIDVERRRAVDRVSALVTRWLTNAEQINVAERLAAGADPSDAFLRVWSLKEARLKALGVGIGNAADASIDSVVAMPLDALLLKLQRDDAPEGYIGAVAFA